MWVLKIFIFTFGCLECQCDNEDLFEANIGEQMTIGLSDKGYKKVELKCGANSMHVNILPESDFDGVIYTQGSFHNQESNCFIDASGNSDTYALRFDFNECGTLNKNEVYSNTLILQHDKELIMPGDTAFHLECDFSRPHDITLSNELTGVMSRITLRDADPSVNKNNKDDKTHTIEEKGSSVILNQGFFVRRREEL